MRPKALISKRIRAVPPRTGWIKSASNYVMSALAKAEAERTGYIEAVFLDAEHHRYFEEGSSSNLFFVMKDDTVVLPRLSATPIPPRRHARHDPRGSPATRG